MADANKIIKKGPGRPKKVPSGPPVPKEGIVQTPSDQRSIVELVYSDPMMFRNMFKYFSRAKPSGISIKFQPTTITFSANDHNDKSISVIELIGGEMNRYYCKEPLEICVGYDHFHTALTHVNKSCPSVSIKLAEHDWRSYVYMELEDRENNATTLYQINTIQARDQLLRIETPPQHMITFATTLKSFRDIVKQAKPRAENIKIERNGRTELKILTETSHGSGMNQARILDAKNIVEDNMTDSDILAVSVRVSVITALATSTLSKDILMSVGDDNYITVTLRLSPPVDPNNPLSPSACMMTVYLSINN
jgi:hypothetical protein